MDSVTTLIYSATWLAGVAITYVIFCLYVAFMRSRWAVGQPILPEPSPASRPFSRSKWSRDHYRDHLFMKSRWATYFACRAISVGPNLCCGCLSSMSCPQNTKHTHLANTCAASSWDCHRQLQLKMRTFVRQNYFSSHQPDHNQRRLPGQRPRRIPSRPDGSQPKRFSSPPRSCATRRIMLFIAFAFQTFLTLQAATASWCHHHCITLPNGT